MKKILLFLYYILLFILIILPIIVHAQERLIFSGTFVVIISERHDFGKTDNQDISYLLIDEKANVRNIVIDEILLERYGGALQLNGKRVTAELIPLGTSTKNYASAGVSPLNSPAYIVEELRLAEVESYAENEEAKKSSMSTTGVLGTKAFVTVLCKFADYPDTEPAPLSWYKGMFDGSDGLDSYWRELSYEAINLSGSKVVGWYTLPHNRSYYVDDTIHWVTGEELKDCLSLADPDVFFPDFYGINLQFNENTWSNHAMIGPVVELSLDNVTRKYAVGWYNNQSYYGSNLYTPNAGHGIYSHEMGHMFGLLHSSGPYPSNSAYDSEWDVMSGGFALMGAVHTISYHKDLLGWIPPWRKWQPGSPAGDTFLIDRLALPQDTSSFLMGEIPINADGNESYTIELRRYAGLDSKLPAEGVIIHRINPNRICSREGCEGPAQVVDPDNNDNPNDAGAVWQPGESFSDPANGIVINILMEQETGYLVKVTQTPTPHTLTIASTNPNSGVPITVSPNDNSAQGNGLTSFTRTYNNSTQVTLTAPATAGGNAFSSWSGCTVASGTTCTVTIDNNKTVTATYATSRRILTVNSSNPGSGVSITASPNDNNGQGNGLTSFTRTYNNSTQVTLTAPSSAGGNNFQNWSNCASTNGTTCYVTMDADKTVTANFSQVNYTLNLSKSGNGSVKVNGDTHTLPWSGQFSSGTNVQIEAVADSGWTFANWTGDQIGSTNPTTIAINGNKSITANFTQNCERILTINISHANSGTVTKNPDKASYCNNEQVSLTANPSAGYKFSSWSGVDSSSGTTASITMNDDRTVTANFSQQTANGPDLAGLWTSFTQSCKNTKKGIKCKITGKITIQNVGNQVAPSSKVRIYISDDSIYDVGDTLFKQLATGKIKIGKSMKRILSYSFPYTVSISGKYIIAIVDADNKVMEPDEINNILVFGPLP